MSGVLCIVAGGVTDLSYSGTVTVATVTDAGKGFAIVQHGYADNAHSVTGTGFGSRSPTTVSGFTIVGLFWESSSISGFTQTTLALTGDASKFGASMTINGLAQNLGAGAFDGTNTTFVSGTSQANPMGADGSSATVVIT